MNDTKTRLDKILAALSDIEKAKTVKAPATDNPLHQLTLADLTAGKGVATSQDQYPALNVAPKSELGYAMENARIEGFSDGKREQVNQRKAHQRARDKRKAEIEEIAARPMPSKARLKEAWKVVEPLTGIVEQIAKSKQRWADRLLGGTTEDLPQMALEQMALAMAKGDYDLDLHRKAAKGLRKMVETADRGRKGIPRDQMSDEQKKESKRLRRARKLLMGMANLQVKDALRASYLDGSEGSWETIDLVDTVMAHINVPGDDPIANRFKADRAPAFLGTRFQRPDGIDAHLLSTGVMAAITARGLDAIVEVMLDEDKRRSNGSVAWTEYAEELFKATPGGYGPWLWEQVVAATGHLKNPRKARGDAARKHVRHLFEFLPDVITGMVEAFDHQFVAWSTTGRRAIMASTFEAYLSESPALRQVLQPALRFATVEEAAQAIREHVAQLSDGNDYIESMVNA